MHFESMLKSTTFALTEGSIHQRLRRFSSIEFDPYLDDGGLIYDDKSAAILERSHREYLEIGQRYGLTMLALTNTWGANPKRIQQSRFRDRRVNQDNARFLARLCNSYGLSAYPIFIGGQIGPRGNAFRPEEALSKSMADVFHATQIEALVEGQVDFLYAAILPALSEAQGIAAAMARTGLPYVIGFVIRQDGKLLDGIPLAQAIETLDQTAPNYPTGYAITCVHPKVFMNALTTLDKIHLQRVLSFQANISARDAGEPDSVSESETESPDTLADLMLEAFQEFGIPFMGGCYGTDIRHIESLARKYQAFKQTQSQP